MDLTVDRMTRFTGFSFREIFRLAIPKKKSCKSCHPEPLAKFLSTQKILSTDYADYTDFLFRIVEFALFFSFFQKKSV
jgi:hypothetical protein